MSFSEIEMPLLGAQRGQDRSPPVRALDSRHIARALGDKAMLRELDRRANAALCLHRAMPRPIVPAKAANDVGLANEAGVGGRLGLAVLIACTVLLGFTLVSL